MRRSCWFARRNKIRKKYFFIRITVICIGVIDGQDKGFALDVFVKKGSNSFSRREQTKRRGEQDETNQQAIGML